MPDKKLIDEIGKCLIRRKETIAVSESVTAGNLQAALSIAENARDFFQGGITAYNLGQKARLLHVDPIHAEHCNCVSSRVAEQMALRAQHVFISTWGVGITGYASPVPECDINDLFCFVSISYNEKIILSKRLKAQKATPEKVQHHYVKEVLSLISTQLRKKKTLGTPVKMN